MAVYLKNSEPSATIVSKTVPRSGITPLNYEISQFSLVLKRLFDLALTVPALIVLLPLFLVLAAWIKLDSPGPVIFQQTRIGKDGRKFTIYKFRTMYDHSDKAEQLCTLETSPLITPCGKVLRKYKLDELPQLFNVLKGEMSLVGPRPLLAKHVSLFPNSVKKLILSVPPGITDYASIAYINENEALCSVKEPERFYIKEILPTKVSYFVFYVVRRNLWMDFKILFLTLIILFGIFLGKIWRIRNWEVIKDRKSFWQKISKYRIPLR